MFVENNLFSGLQSPAAGVRTGALRAVAAAFFGVWACCRDTRSKSDMGGREALGIFHLKTRPSAQNQVQIYGKIRADGAEVPDCIVNIFVLFREAKDLAVGISCRNCNHTVEIISTGDISGDVEPEVTVHHDGTLDFAPVLVGVVTEDGEISYVSVPNGGAKSLELVCVALVNAFAVATGDDRWQRNAWNSTHLGV